MKHNLPKDITSWTDKDYLKLRDILLSSHISNSINISDLDIDEYIYADPILGPHYDLNFMFRNDEEFNQNISKWNTSNIKSFTCMFYNCKSFYQDLSKWNLSNLRSNNGILGMFYNTKITPVDLLKWGWYTSHPTIDWSLAFIDPYELDDFNYDITGIFDKVINNSIDIDSLYLYDIKLPTLSKDYFGVFKNKDIPRGTETWNVDDCRNLSGLFYKAKNTKGMNLSGWKLHISLDNKNIKAMFKDTDVTIDYIEGWGWSKQRPDLDWKKAF